MAPNKLVPILIYILFLFILAALFTYLVAAIYSGATGVSFDAIKASYSLSTEEFKNLSVDVLKANAVTQGYANLLIYALTAAIAVFFVRNEFVDDFKKLKDRKKFYLWYIPVVIIGFVGICYLVDVLINIAVPSSENQLQIENIFKYGGMIPMILTSLIFAPIVEEIVFRKCIFGLLGKKKIVLAYIISIVGFVLPHMLSTSTDFGTWALQCIPYIVAASLLAVIYHLSDFNIYTTILCHMANNLLAVILVLAH